MEGVRLHGNAVGGPSLFFTVGGRMDHIKFFITDLQKMRELNITPTCWGFFFPSFSFYKKQSQERKYRRQTSQAPGFRLEETMELRTEL